MLSAFLNLTTLDVSYQWNHTIFSVWLILLSRVFPRCIHVGASNQNFISFYGWIVSYFVYIYHISFIFSSVDGNLAYVHFFAMGIFLLLCIFTYKCPLESLFSSFLGTYLNFRYLSVELLGHMVILCLSFWKSAKLFSTLTAWFYIPINNARGSRFLHIVTNVYLPLLLILTVLGDLKCYLVFTFICICCTFMTNELFY